jgi:flagellar motor switch protein FliN/FliY
LNSQNQEAAGTDELLAAGAAQPRASLPVGSGTFDLLLDVALPVAVSFGRAQLQIREVLKLNSGSIIELNRLVNEPVDVVVNDSVIARGEVVVVDGNYGVRITQIASREDRIRTGMSGAQAAENGITA